MYAPSFPSLLRLPLFLSLPLCHSSLCHAIKRFDFSGLLVIRCFLAHICFTDYGVLIGSLLCTRDTQPTRSGCRRNNRQPVSPPDGAHGVGTPQVRRPAARIFQFIRLVRFPRAACPVAPIPRTISSSPRPPDFRCELWGCEGSSAPENI